MRDNTIKAVYDDDLTALLKKLYVYDDVIAGEKKCIFCGDVINLDNIDGILPVDGQVAFSCSKPRCRMKMLSNGVGV